MRRPMPADDTPPRHASGRPSLTTASSTSTVAGPLHRGRARRERRRVLLPARQLGRAVGQAVLLGARVGRAPHELRRFINGLELSHGLTLLDFGVGSGWTSWMFSQLGCRVIASDISEAALRIAAERYARLPLVGNVSAPVLQLFDGHRFELEDESGRPHRRQRCVPPRAQPRRGARRVRASPDARRHLRHVGTRAGTLPLPAVAERDAQLPRRGAQHDHRGDRAAGARWDSRRSRSVCTSGCPTSSTPRRSHRRSTRRRRSRTSWCERSWRTAG